MFYKFVGKYKAPIHVVIGMAGQKLSQNLLPAQPAYMEFVDNADYGYTRLHFANATHFHLQFFSNAIGNGQVRDEFWIIRSS